MTAHTPTPWAFVPGTPDYRCGELHAKYVRSHRMGNEYHVRDASGRLVSVGGLLDANHPEVRAALAKAGAR